MIIKKAKEKMKEKKRSRILHNQMQIVINIFIYQLVHVAYCVRSNGLKSSQKKGNTAEQTSNSSNQYSLLFV